MASKNCSNSASVISPVGLSPSALAAWAALSAAEESKNSPSSSTEPPPSLAAGGYAAGGGVGSAGGGGGGAAAAGSSTGAAPADPTPSTSACNASKRDFSAGVGSTL